MAFLVVLRTPGNMCKEAHDVIKDCFCLFLYSPHSNEAPAGHQRHSSTQPHQRTCRCLYRSYLTIRSWAIRTLWGFMGCVGP